MKILIKNGTIIDGNNTQRVKKDILIENERIVKIDKNIMETDSVDKIINAENKIVTPGFIDTHSHSALSILTDSFNSHKIRQGITTEVLGQDGISVSPLPLEYKEEWKKILIGFDGVNDKIDYTWETTENYFNLLEKKGLAGNQLYLLPQGNVRMKVMGFTSRPANDSEIKKMCEITREEMKKGAAGISTGLIYSPCCYSEKKELVEICKVVAEFNRPLVVHQRSEADTILESMKEIIEISKESGIHIHFSHFKVCGKKNWDKINDILKLLDSAKEEGIKISFDQYPYAAGSTSLGVVIPPWVHEGGVDKLVERLKDSENRKKIISDIENGIPGWDNFIDFAGFDGIYIISVKTEKNKKYIGKNLMEIGKLSNKNIYDSIFDLLIEEENSIGMYDYYGTDNHVATFMTREECNICTDGILSENPHPRLYSSFPRVINKFVKEMNVLSLENAIYKMTKKPAKTFQIQDRGILKEGYFADIVIFDEKEIKDMGTFSNPKEYPKGIEQVIINGEIILNNNVQSSILPGKIIKL
ncbi:MAG: N-acyl-D-amino-acid deacylase family protein [Cetobacterium sp.]